MNLDSIEGLTDEQINEIYSEISQENNLTAGNQYICQYVQGKCYVCGYGDVDLSCSTLLNWGYYYIPDGDTHTFYAYLAYVRCRGGAVRMDYCS